MLRRRYTAREQSASRISDTSRRKLCEFPIEIPRGASIPILYVAFTIAFPQSRSVIRLCNYIGIPSRTYDRDDGVIWIAGLCSDRSLFCCCTEKRKLEGTCREISQRAAEEFRFGSALRGALAFRPMHLPLRSCAILAEVFGEIESIRYNARTGNETCR